jgi:hypothetical protein
MARSRLEAHLLRSMAQIQAELAVAHSRVNTLGAPAGQLATCVECLSPFRLVPDDPVRKLCPRCRTL